MVRDILKKKNDGEAIKIFAGDRSSKPRYSTETVGCAMVKEIEGLLRREPFHGGLRGTRRPSGCAGRR